MPAGWQRRWDGIPRHTVGGEPCLVAVLVRPLDQARLNAEVSARAQGQHHASDGMIDVVEVASVGLNDLTGGGRQCAYDWHLSIPWFADR